MNTFIQAPAPRARQKEATRRAVLAAARALFVERGFERTTIRDVAARAGVAVGTVFVHFPDKGALLAATLDERLAATLARAFATLPRGSARAQLAHLVGALYRMYARAPVLSRVLVQQSLFLEGAGQEASAARLADFLRSLVELLSRPGALRAGLEPEVAVRAVFAAYLLCLVEGLSGERFSVKAQLTRFERMVEPWFRGSAPARGVKR